MEACSICHSCFCHCEKLSSPDELKKIKEANLDLINENAILQERSDKMLKLLNVINYQCDLPQEVKDDIYLLNEKVKA